MMQITKQIILRVCWFRVYIISVMGVLCNTKIWKYGQLAWELTIHHSNIAQQLRKMDYFMHVTAVLCRGTLLEDETPQQQKKGYTYFPQMLQTNSQTLYNHRLIVVSLPETCGHFFLPSMLSHTSSTLPNDPSSHAQAVIVWCWVSQIHDCHI